MERVRRGTAKSPVFATGKNGSLSIRKKLIYTNDSYVETKDDLCIELSGIKYKIANNQLEPYKTNVLKEYWQKLIPLNYKYRSYPQITDLSSCSKEDKNKGFDLSTLVNEALKKKLFLSTFIDWYTGRYGKYSSIFSRANKKN